MPKLDLQGKRFGKLVANRIHEVRNSVTYWECLCDCGNTSIVSRAHLISGHTKSCGCARNDNFHDLTNLRFGKLVALNPMKKRSNGGVVWLCQCDCGKQAEIVSASLVRGLTTSCGCITRERMRSMGKLNQKKFSETEYVDDTNLSRLTAKTGSLNTSGQKGVGFHKRIGKWYASITCQKKRIHLGYFTKFEDAVKARERAEEELFEPILNAHGRTLYPEEHNENH